MSPPPYQLSVDGFPDDHFRVHSFVGKEAISEAYVFDIAVTAPLQGDEEIERTALGQRATLTWNVGKGPRAFYGVLAAVRLEGMQGTDDHHFQKLRMRLVPRLWLLKRKKRTRIFQNMRVPDVVTAVLLEAGIASKWQLLRVYPAREYCTQYEESDYRFVTRLLAEAGIFFYFPEGPPVSAADLAAASIAGAVGGMADSVLGAVAGPAGSAIGALAGGLASAAAPLVPGDTVVCGDDASWYPSMGGDSAAELDAAEGASLLGEAGAAFGVGDAGGAALGAVSAVAGSVIAAATASSAPSLHYLAMQHTANAHTDKVTRFSAETSVRADVATYREYDPQRPMVQLTSAGASTAPFPPSPAEIAAGAAYAAGAMASGLAPLAGAAGAVLGGVAAVAGAVDSLIGQLSPASNLEAYEHHGPFLFPKWAAATDEAPRILRQKRRRASMAEGDSGCPDLAPGHRFALQDHPADHLDRPYVVTSVEHHGHPEGGDRPVVYRNTFECTPAEVTYVPPRPKRKSVQVSLTATVVGPAGEEIYVDAMGQIKVQFHWDRAGTFDAGSSCWIRTMQPWGGAGWGVQFIPRVGMEVVVLFEGGDPDKPMVLGSLYNGTHPSPFVLPGDRTRSGWRTQSSPGGGGFNELSFEDAATQEQIYVHAQRDLDEAVERDHTRRVGEDERIAVARDRALTVGGDQHLVTKKVRRELVGADSHLHVKGDQRQKVDQKMSLAAHDLHIKVDAKHALEAADEVHIKAGKTLVIEVGEDLTIKGPGGFIRIDAGGVTIKGTLVKINSGGSPGSAGDASPDAPDDATEAQVAGVESTSPDTAPSSPPPSLPPAGGGAPGGAPSAPPQP